MKTNNYFQLNIYLRESTLSNNKKLKISIIPFSIERKTKCFLLILPVGWEEQQESQL